MVIVGRIDRLSRREMPEVRVVDDKMQVVGTTVSNVVRCAKVFYAKASPDDELGKMLVDGAMRTKPTNGPSDEGGVWYKVVTMRELPPEEAVAYAL